MSAPMRVQLQSTCVQSPGGCRRHLAAVCCSLFPSIAPVRVAYLREYLSVGTANPGHGLRRQRSYRKVSLPRMVAARSAFRTAHTRTTRCRCACRELDRELVQDSYMPECL